MRDGKVYTTRASQSLINEVTYPIMMSDEIDSRSRKNDPMIGTLFVKPKEVIVPASGPEQNGTIISIISERGYGFIRPSEGGDNLFFHVTSLIDCTIDELEHGARVSYRVIQSDRGLNAVEIRLIES